MAHHRQSLAAALTTKSLHFAALLIVSLAVTACGDRSEPAQGATETAPAAVETATADAAPFDASTLPVSTAELGDFRYLSMPDGFRLTETKTLGREQKYVFPGGRNLIVKGRYQHGRIMIADGAPEWNETLLLNHLGEQISSLGGRETFDGGLPDETRALLESNSTRFARDLYDPAPYRFGQYAIRTDKALIWIEIGYGYNAPMVDLTVVEQSLPQPEPAA